MTKWRMVTRSFVTMYIEKRINGSYYLRESLWDSKGKKKVSKAIYLGKDSRNAYEKLATLTTDEALLKELAEVYDCDESLGRIIKVILDHRQKCDYDNINKVLDKCIVDLQRFWNIRSDDDGTHQECQGCLHHHADDCRYFHQRIKVVVTSHPCRAFQRCTKSKN
jgi:hypothetical protein